MAEEKNLSEALRAEILKLATEGDPEKEKALTAGVLGRILRVAKTGRDLLVALEASPSSLMQMARPGNGQYLGGNPFGVGQDGDASEQGFAMTGPIPFASPPLPNENFGTVAIREFISAAKALQGGQGSSPAKLVEAIAVARQEGLADVERELRAKLGVAQEPEPVSSEKEGA